MVDSAGNTSLMTVARDLLSSASLAALGRATDIVAVIFDGGCVVRSR
jgi:hypothetical protein